MLPSTKFAKEKFLFFVKKQINMSKNKHKIDQRKQLETHPFTFKFTKDQKLIIYRNNQQIKIVKGKTSARFANLLENKADELSIQLALAKITGHYKHGNEQ